ncbi:hypothetical protein ELQ90_04095 [Labedella phragmitis]|uniref:Fibronectin type III domain-containing protein n=1 Tax=Labedella phragmitis TaxID=2498849 RepID=A0A444PZ77_9MICO|nr:hypothetical protein [Labedella phragmitis]RWZ53113.1 hypothetical protein ELQ90_04095 [Labedella phragmitis]
MSDRATTPTRRVSRARRRLPLVLTLVVSLLLAVVPGTALAAPAIAATSGVTVVDIPYRSTADVAPAQGWTIADCGAITAPAGIGVACEPSKLTFSAPDYDPELPRQDVAVTLTTGTTTLAVVYSVGLAPPEPPALASTVYPVPFAQGSRVLVPLSDLRVACTLCSAEGETRIEAVGVSPRRAGTLGVTSTHLELAAAPDFTGEAELNVRVMDDLGHPSETATLTVSVYPTGPSTLLAQHTVVEAERDGSTTIDLASLVASSDPDETPIVTGCGAAVRGTAVCAGEGTAEFRASDAPVDQFSFTVVTEDGEHAVGSVTVVAAGLADAPLPGPLTADAAPESRVIVPSRIPVEDPPAPEPSPFDALIGLLDRASG